MAISDVTFDWLLAQCFEEAAKSNMSADGIVNKVLSKYKEIDLEKEWDLSFALTFALVNETRR